MVKTYSFGYWVSRRRKALDLTRAELAQCIGCATETIKKIERDERRPSVQIAGLLAKALALPPEQHSLFLQIARGEHSVDRLDFIPDSVPITARRLHNFPLQTTTFIGREKELAEIQKLLANPECRLLTLVGPGGAGKSRIALRFAETQIGMFRDGIYLVSLVRLESAEAVPMAIAGALGLELKGPARSQLLDYLRDTRRELLLILDNFEHLDDASGLLIEILQYAPQVKLLVTSQVRLNLQSEWLLSIDGLPFPASITTEAVDQYSAVALFAQRALRLRHDFDLDEIEKPFVARICQLVDGMPLAIELAASWTRVLSCREIAREIEDGIDILATSERDVADRHRNIKAVFDRSWKLLSEMERTVLSKLSLFRGRFSRQSAEQVAGASLSLLSSLVDKSLLRLELQSGDSQQFGFHELIRRYAYDRLLEAGEEKVSQLRDQHLDHFLALAEQAETELTGPNNLFWFDYLDQNFDNMRVAFNWAVSTRNGAKAQILVSALWWFWCMRGHVDEACQWAECALALPSENPSSRAKATWVSGFLHYYHGNQAIARERLEEGTQLCRNLGDPGKRDLASALHYLGVEAEDRGDLAAVQSYWEESLSLRREVGDAWGISQSLFVLGARADEFGDPAKARLLSEEGLISARASGDRTRMIFGLQNLAWLAAGEGDYSEARELLKQCLVLSKELGSRHWGAKALESFLITQPVGTNLNETTKAARLWGAVDALHKAHGSSAYLRDESVQQIDALRESLGEATFSNAWNEGLSMTLNEAMDYAIEEHEEHGPR